jgi:hypothetical protein
LKKSDKPMIEPAISSDAALAAFLRKVRPCCQPGEGVHSWLFHAACCAIEAGLEDEQAEGAIEALMTRDVINDEIADALAAAHGDRHHFSPRWSLANPAAIATIAKEGLSLVELVAHSPQPIQFGGESRTEEVIDTLFPGSPWLCVGKSDRSFRTDRRESWRGHLHERALIVPSPMLSQVGRTRQGRLSFHTLENTGPRRFIVVEFDRGSLDQQAAILWHLAGHAPMALVVFSGSKSCHGWFFCAGQPEDKVARFFDYAVSLGADKALWTRSQFVRMPDGRRFDNKTNEALVAAGIRNVPQGLQAALYFNPGIIR